MADLRWNHVLQQLRGLVRPPDGGLTDAQLLARWLASRDEAAFELLVWRHGPTVLGVCRRLLRGSQDIEDAFQATFLVFLRRAGSISKREAVASWLYKVAYRIALQARRRSGRLQLLDGQDRLIPAAESSDETAWRDIRPVLVEEVSRLPVRYRAAFVLCCLQGKTNEEAARELGVPLGTVLSRLSRARARLRSRLTRRGVTLGAGLVAGALASEASASVPASLVGFTMKAALLGAAEQAAAAGVVTAQAAVLTKGALHAMWLTKMQTTAAVVLSVVLLGGGSAFTYRTLAAGPANGQSTVAKNDDTPRRVKQKDKPSDPKSTDLRLQNQRLTYRLEIAQANSLLQAKEVANYRTQLEAVQKERNQLAARLKHLTAQLDESQKQNQAVASFIATPLLPASERTVSRAAPAATVEDAQDDVDIVKAQLQAKQAELAVAKVDVNAAERSVARLDRLAKSAVISKEEVDAARDKVMRLQAIVQVKEAQLQEQAIRLRQAMRRLNRLRGAHRTNSNASDAQLRELRNDLDRLRRKLDALEHSTRPHAANGNRQ